MALPLTLASRQPNCFKFETLLIYTAGVKPLALAAIQLHINMVFEELFEAVNWKPIKYKGRTVLIGDELPISNEIKEYQITFESVNSDWEQGIFVASKGAHLLINGKEEKLNGCYFWYSESLMTNSVKVLKKGKKDLKVWNIWRINKGPMQYGHNGAALFVENLPNGKRYFCNDGYPDDDFDDLIFRINWVENL
jgi:hypothetical protein